MAGPQPPQVVITMPVYQGVDLLDVTGPFEMFGWAGFAIDLVAETPGLIRTRDGFAFEVTKRLDDARPCDALWVPGGAPEALTRIMADPEQCYLRFLRRQAEQSRYVTSVCEGALLLAAAGLLDGYSVTTHWAFIPCLKNPRFGDVTVVEGHPRFHLDRNRLTGGGISSGLDEALKLIEMLTDTATAERAQQVTQYYPRPPVESSIPEATSCPVLIPPAPPG